MEIRLIATDEDYEETLAEIRRLWAAPAGSQDRNRLELLAMLAHHYERQREPLPDQDPVAAIRFRMEQAGLSRKDLVPVFGSTARVSEVLNGKRRLTLEMIRRLHAAFDIPLEALVAPSGRDGKSKGARSTQSRKRRQVA